ncbi:MAG: trypsin-like serine protease [Gammaproteobacteria bacterium]
MEKRRKRMVEKIVRELALPILGLGFVLLNAMGAAQAAENVKTGAVTNEDMQRFLPRIVGGAISQQVYPWMVSLQFVFPDGSSGHMCGGSLINSQWVLTAAHCVVDGLTPADLRIIANVNLLNSANAVPRNVQNIQVHEQYSGEPEFVNDIALLQLTEPYDIQTPVGLADENVMTTVTEDSLVRVIGWGTLIEGAVDTPNELYEVDLPMRTNAQCQQSYPGADALIQGDIVCAGLPEGGIDSCQGDSGGPLFISDGAGGFSQVGVVSWGGGCARPGQYGVYTRVASYTDWINGRVNGLLFEGPTFVGYAGINTTVTRVIGIRNNGATPITAQSVTLGGPNAASFSIDASACMAAPIVAGGMCEVSMSATATTPGELTATVTATLDSVISPTISVEIVAVGLPELPIGANTLDTTAAKVFSGDGAVWVSDADAAAQGGSALKSGVIVDNESSVALAVVMGPGTASFSYRVSSEPTYDKLLVLHNGESIVDASGEVPYTKVTVDLVPGENHLTFGYVKDVSDSAGQDAAWIDNLVVTAAGAAPAPTAPSPTTPSPTAGVGGAVDQQLTNDEGDVDDASVIDVGPGSGGALFVSPVSGLLQCLGLVLLVVVRQRQWKRAGKLLIAR